MFDNLKNKVKSAMGGFSVGEIETLLQPALESKLLFKKNSLVWAFVSVDVMKDVLDIRGYGLDRQGSIKDKEKYLPDLKVSEYKKLVSKVKALLTLNQSESFDMSDVKEFLKITCLFNYKDYTDYQKAKEYKGNTLVLQVWYVHKDGAREKTEPILGTF